MWFFIPSLEGEKKKVSFPIILSYLSVKRNEFEGKRVNLPHRSRASCWFLPPLSLGGGIRLTLRQLRRVVLRAEEMHFSSCVLT